MKRHLLNLRTQEAELYLRKAQQLVNKSVMEPPICVWEGFDLYQVHIDHDKLIKEAASLCAKARIIEAEGRHKQQLK